MPACVLLTVLAAAALHAAWNAMVKGRSGNDPLLASAVIALGSAALAVPGLGLTGLPDTASLVYVAASAVIHVAYFLIIGFAYRKADYSAVYPLTRGSAPLATALFGAVFFGEALRPPAWAGIALLSCGVAGLGFDALRRRGLDRHGLGLIALNAGVIVIYTLIDGHGARAAGNAASYVLGMMLLTGVLLFPVAYRIRGRALLETLRTRWLFGLAGGGMATLSYGTALWAMTKVPIGLVAALRETSVLFAALIAAVMLGERFGYARWLAASAIVAGLASMRLA